MYDVVKVVDTLDSMGLIRKHKVINKYYQVYCPFHNDGNEKKPSCGILLQDEYWDGKKLPQGWLHCFSCGHIAMLPDAISEILKSRSISKSGEEWLKENVPGYQSDEDIEYDTIVPEAVMQSLETKYALDYVRNLSYGAKTTYVTEEELASYRYTVPYMYERKLTDEIIEKFDVGVDINWTPEGSSKCIPCITFPVRDREGHTLFLCRRSIEGKFYHYPKGVTKPVYGLDMLPDRCRSVVVCESIINCLTCWIYGYPAVALLGTGNSYQIQQLKELGVSEFVLCMDGDNAGDKATSKLKRALSKVAIVYSMNMIRGKDVNDIDKDTFDKLYQEKE